MQLLYLRFIIGGAAALFVAIVAMATLGLSVTIAFDTLRRNAEDSVTRLGLATAVTTDDLFAKPAKRLITLASFPRWGQDATTTPSDDPSFIPAVGGPPMEKWRRAIIGMAIEGKFSDIANEALFIDGSWLRLLPVSSVSAPLFALATAAPNGSSGLAQTLSAYDTPSGDFNQFFTTALLPRANSLVFPSLLEPAYVALWNSWLGSTPDDQVKWAAPLGARSLGKDYFFVSMLTRIRNMTGVIGNCAVRVSLADIGSVLSAAKLTSNTEAFVYDADLFLIGASSRIPTFVGQNSSALTTSVPGCTTTAQAQSVFPSDLPRMLCRYHIQNAPFAPLAVSAKAEPLFFANAGAKAAVKLIKKNYVFTQRLPTPNGDLQLTVTTVTPEDDVLGDAKNILPISAGVTAVVVVVIAVLSFILVWLVLRPLEGIALRMAKAARLEPDEAAVDISPIAEIGDLQRSFVEMRDELSRIRAFVPQSLLRAGSADDEDDLVDNNTDLSHSNNNNNKYKSPASHSLRLPGSGGDVLSDDRELSPSSRSSGRTCATATIAGRTGAGGGNRGFKHITGTRTQTVAVLCVNLRGFHAATEHGVSADKMAALVDIVLSCASAEKGVVDSFHGDRFMLTFNAATPCANCGTRATLAAVRMVAAISAGKTAVASSPSPQKNTSNKEWGSGRGLRHEGSTSIRTVKSGSDITGSPTDSKVGDLPNSKSGGEFPLQVQPSVKMYDLPVICGVSVGPAQVGNVGSAAMKSFSVIGPVVTQAAMLVQLCKMYSGAQCLVPQRLFADLSTAVQFETVDFVKLPFAQSPCLIANVLKPYSSANDAGEWMYQLHAQEHRRSVGQEGGAGAGGFDRVQVSNAVWSLLSQGRRQDAAASFDKLSSWTATSALTSTAGLDSSARSDHRRPSHHDPSDGAWTAGRAMTSEESLRTRMDETAHDDADKGELLPRDFGAFYKTVTKTW